MQITLSPPKTLAHWLLIFRLYRKAFPASERKPFGIILTMYRKRKTDLWCILRDGSFAGFAQYKRFYRNHYSAWAAEHIQP